MDFIEYKYGLPFRAVTYPFNVKDALVVQDLKLEQLINFINSKRLTKIVVDGIDDLSFIQRCPSVEHVLLDLKLSLSSIRILNKKGNYYIKQYDISPLYQMDNLKSITINDKVEPIVKVKMDIDLSLCNKIEDISAEYGFLRNIDKSKTLKSVNLISYKPQSKDISELRNSKKLDTIRIVKGNLESLYGIEELPNIQCIYLYHLRYLNDISDLKRATKTLKALRIGNCANIHDFSVLRELENLELLELWGSNTLPSLDFLKGMKSLKTLVLNMNVLDGDLDLCKNLSCVYVEPNRKHYNLKDVDLPKGNFIRGNEDIEEWRRME